jgi:hypothetical protein
MIRSLIPAQLQQSPDGYLWASGDTLVQFTPAANQPPSSNYATFNTRNGHLVLEFDTTTQETAIFAGVMPRNYGGGNIVAYVAWMAASAVTGTIGWGITFERDNDANHDLDADAFATEQIITAATVDATSGKVKTTNVVITAGAAGTDSVAAGDPFRLRVRRDVANDTAAGDAQFLSVELKEA